MDPRTQSRCWALALLVVSAATGSFANAQSLAARSALGLQVFPETRVFDMPLDDAWSVTSSVTQPTLASADGLKIDIGAGYGWNVTKRSRLSLFAELGLADESAPRWTAGDMAGAMRAASADTGSSFLGPRDVAFGLRWNWARSSAFAFTSGLGLRYALSDPLAAGWSTPVKPSSASGYIGLRYSF